MTEANDVVEASGDVKGVLLLVGGLLFFALIIVVWALGPLVFGHYQAQYVLEHGLPAQAQILDLTDTGTQINNQPLVAITLEVMPPGQPEYTATVKQVVSVLNVGYFSRGNVIPVKYDPDHPDHVAIVFGP